MTARRGRGRDRRREQQRQRRRVPETATRSVQLRPRQQRTYVPVAGGLRTRAARHQHRGRVPCRHITGALAGRRCTPQRRSAPALPLITGALARNFHDSNRVLFGRERGFRSLLER